MYATSQVYKYRLSIALLIEFVLVFLLPCVTIAYL